MSTHVVPNDETKDYIKNCETVRAYDRKKKKACSERVRLGRCEYILLDKELLLHSNVAAIAEWINSKSVDDFVDKHVHN